MDVISGGAKKDVGYVSLAGGQSMAGRKSSRVTHAPPPERAASNKQSIINLQLSLRSPASLCGVVAFKANPFTRIIRKRETLLLRLSLLCPAAPSGWWRAPVQRQGVAMQLATGRISILLGSPHADTTPPPTLLLFFFLLLPRNNQRPLCLAAAE